MEFYYALKGPFNGSNSHIKNAISIQFINPLPPMPCGIHSNQSIAMGNFRPRFIVSAPKEYESNNILFDLTGNGKSSADFKIIRYSMIDKKPVEDYVIDFYSFFLTVFLIGSGDKNNVHAFELTPSGSEYKILHTAYKLGSTATLMPSTAWLVEYIKTDMQGQGSIMPDTL